MDETAKILREWLTDRKFALVENQQAIGIYASGESGLGTRVEEYEGGARLVDTSGYMYYQIYGRGPGGFPPIDSILNWIRIKPIISYGNISERSLAFLIARKIAREGIKVPNPHNDGTLFSRTFNEQTTAPLLSLLGDRMRVDVSSQLVKSFKNTQL